eukprot:CAMPEP_0181200686 /NCGR_PEP_ID=MMETSP1096-20121128/17902_1 /TAXON_ID=156174 ORGANISM="Chrysochromulina ericina, Strain CCMP281" /NCGR_SAMPLE_ID=MMETSP1096 /ASSEMBLY_ACC=CAM_ASM_000453 /LENGTH=139 /DNA_ID=CAMNT_0023291071 /DNA_START=543 /DNA_END=964 /DNA_ORIENTATION=-
MNVPDASKTPSCSGGTPLRFPAGSPRSAERLELATGPATEPVCSDGSAGTGEGKTTTCGSGAGNTRGSAAEGVPDWWGEQVARGEIQEQEEAMVAPLVIAAAEWAGHLAWVEAADAMAPSSIMVYVNALRHDIDACQRV